MKNIVYFLILISSACFSQKISDLPAATTPLAGTELLPVVQSGATRKATAQDVADLASGLTDGDKGDVTVSGSGATWTVDNGAITYAKFQNLTGLSIFGRSANSTGVAADITAGTDAHVLRRSGTTLGFGTIGNSSISDLAFSKLTSTPTTLAGYGITNSVYERGGNAFGGASTLGLTDDFNLTTQTGNASLLFNTNATNRLTITNTGAATFNSTATSFGFLVNGTSGAAASEQIAFRIGGTTKFAVRDNGEIIISPTNGNITSGTGLVFSTNATQNILYDYSAITGTTNSITGNRTSIGSWTHTTGSGQNIVNYNAIGTFAPNASNAAYAAIVVNSTINTSGTYAGNITGLVINRTLTSTTGANMYGVIVPETATSNGFGTGSPTAILHVVGTTKLQGSVTLPVAGNGILIKEGTDATMGVATLVGGTVVVSTTKVTANSRIFLTGQNLGTITVPVGYAVSARTPGTSFTILSANVVDTSIVAWTIIEPAP